MKNPKVSVIIPAYNVEKYIAETVRCFLQQTLKNIEVIIVNDGSTDDTLSICQKFSEQDSRVSVISQANKGAGVARNAGMKHATGEYMYFFDGDDFCVPQFLDIVVKKAEETSADIVVFDYYRIDEISKKTTLYHGLNQTLLPKGKTYFNYKDVPDRILSIVNPTPWNKLYRREFIAGTKLQFLGLSSTNDITFAALSVAMAEKIVYVDEAFMYYRINRPDAITAFKQSKLNNIILAVQGTIDQAKQIAYFDEIKNAVNFFAIDNLFVGLERYAGRFRSKYYRRYYCELHKMFNSEVFASVNRENLRNDRIFSKFNDVKCNSYIEKGFKIAKERIKAILPMSRKDVIRENKDILSVQTKELQKVKADVIRENKNILSAQTKELQKVEALERTVKDLKKKVEFSEKQLSNITLQLTTMSQALDCINWNGINDSKRSPLIVVSMTSYPARINTVKESIKSIMLQSVKADKIILWLAKSQFPEGEEMLPEGLLALKRKGLEICWCDYDYRSYKKILPALEKFPNDIIITADDDLIFPYTMIESLYDSYKRHPMCISTLRVHLMAFDENNTIKPYTDWKKEDSTYIDVPRNDLFATTGAGTLFPPHCLPQETMNWNAIEKNCPYADDIWIKIMAVSNNIPVVLVCKQKRLVYINGTQEAGLWNNINKEQNDVQLQNLLTVYSILPEAFIESNI